MATTPAAESSSLYEPVCYFYVLPFEIRVFIVRLCLPSHRTISAKWSAQARELSFCKSDIPAVLTVCWEFRNEALKFYQPLVKPNSTTDLQFYIHKASDSVRITDNSPTKPAIEAALLDIDACVLRVAQRTGNLKLNSVHVPDYGCHWCRWPFLGDSLYSIYLLTPGGRRWGSA